MNMSKIIIHKIIIILNIYRSWKGCGITDAFDSSLPMIVESSFLLLSVFRAALNTNSNNSWSKQH